MTSNQRLLCCCVALAAVWLPTSVAVAQVTTGDILGTITDPSGAVVPNAKIVITNNGTHESHTVSSDASGQYILTNLSAGTYSVEASAAGFKSGVASVRLDAAARLRQDFKLALGQTTETVEVTGAPPALETDSSTVSTVVTELQAQQLPLNGRNFFQLAQLAAGANEGPVNALANGTRPDDRRPTASVSVYAQSDTLNNVLMDGVDNNERTVGSSGVRPSVEAIAEFRVETNLPPAEVGKTPGAVVNLITRSGTNNFHGAVYEFLRNDLFDARNFFAGTGPKPEYRQNQFGGAVGGPIRKNKTFFFTDYEGLRIIQGVTYRSRVPTLFEEQNIGNFSDIGGPVLSPSQISSIALNYFKLYPAPNLPGIANTFNFVYNPNRTQNSDTVDARIDQNFSDHDRFFARYSFDNVNTFTPDALPPVNGISPGGSTASFPGNAPDRSQQVAFSYSHLFHNDKVLELRAGFTRINLQSYPLNYGKALGSQFGIVGANFNMFTNDLPTVSITGYSGFGNSNSVPLIWLNNVFQYGGTFTQTIGHHNLKYGAQLVRRQIYNQQNGSGSGSFTFTTRPTPFVLANFLQGFADTVSRSVLLQPFYFRTWEPGFFAQDDWRVLPWLTLNVGLRYDIFTPFTDAAGTMATFSPATASLMVTNQNGVSASANVKADYGSLGPRIGFAATVAPNTVVRGGFGMIFYRDNTGMLVPFLNPPNYVVYGPNPQTVPLDAPLPIPTLGTASASTSRFAIQPNYRNAYVEQFNLNVEHSFGATVASIRYVGELTRHQRIAYGLDYAPPSPLSFVTRRPYYSILPNITSITEIASDGYTDYHGMTATLERRLNRGLTLSANYTWSHAIGDFQSYSTGGSYTSVVPSLTAILERGNTDLDVRHRFNMMLTYAIPFGQHLTGWEGALLKGWQFNAIDVWQTGSPFSVTDSVNQANTGGGTDRPNQIADWRVSDPNLARWFNTAAFQLQPLGSVGTEGRNVLSGPHFRHFDASLAKNFNITERFNLQFRAESFNLTNTPNFNQPAATVNSPATFGIISSTRPGSTPRDFQFGLRLSF
jgi:outer membrane receptor protein involved in Fe transport